MMCLIVNLLGSKCLSHFSNHAFQLVTSRSNYSFNLNNIISTQQLPIIDRHILKKVSLTSLIKGYDMMLWKLENVLNYGRRDPWPHAKGIEATSNYLLYLASQHVSLFITEMVGIQMITQ